MKKLIAVAVIGAALAIAAAFAPGQFSPASLFTEAVAAPPTYSLAVPVNTMPIHLGGPFTAASTTPLNFKLPYSGKVVGFSGAARTISGTITVDLQSGGVSLLSATLTLSTASSDAVITGTGNVAAGSVVTAIVATSGTSPTVSDITILPTFVRR